MEQNKIPVFIMAMPQLNNKTRIETCNLDFEIFET